MKMTLQHLDLRLAHPFTIARGSISTQRSLVVRLEHGGEYGLGEVSENSYYGHTIESMCDSLALVQPLLRDCADPTGGDWPGGDWPAQLWQRTSQTLVNDMFALSALDIAAHDLWAKIQGVPLYQAWGLTWNEIPASSYTIGIATIDEMIAKLNEQAGWSIYKIKLGTANDLEIVRQLRQHTAAIFRIDANCGWGYQETIDNAAELAQMNVQFIEQPLPIDAPAAERERVFTESKLPIIADEACQIEDDVDRCHRCFHGVNIKLCKCGGLTPALRMLHHAKSLGLKTMVGCMIESSIGISAAAHLLPLLDYADLDGATLLQQDPAEGVKILQGRVELTGRPGSGARLA